MKKAIYFISLFLAIAILTGCAGTKPDYSILEGAEQGAGKVSSYSAATEVATNDVLLGVDISDKSMAPTGTTKKFTTAVLKAFFTDIIDTDGDGDLSDEDPVFNSVYFGANQITAAIAAYLAAINQDLGTTDDVTFNSVTIGGNDALDDGDIGSTVQAYDAQLADIAAIAPAAGNNGQVVASNGTNLVLTDTLYAGVSPHANLVTSCEGTEDGGSDSNTVCTDSGETFIADGAIGMTLYNMSDVSSCTITDNDTTTFTCDGLTGGTDNLFQDGDSWAIAPGPNQSGGVTYINIAAGTTILHPATAEYSQGYYIIDTTATVSIDPQSASMTLNFDASGTFTDPGAGDEVDGPTSDDGAFIWFHNASTTEAYSWGVNGSFSDGGAS